MSKARHGWPPAEMYPKRSTEALLGELVGAALEAVETSLPYVRGTRDRDRRTGRSGL